MASYVYKDVLTRASTTIQVIEDVAIYKAQLFSTNGNIFSQRDTTSEISVKVFKGLEDITNRFTDIVWKRFTASGNNIVEDTKWGEQHNGKKTIVITRDDINEKANIQVEVYTTINSQRTLAASDFITFIDVNDMDGSPTPPENPKDGDLWLDTSVMPPRLMVWDNSLGSWIEVAIAGRDRRNLLRNSNFFKKSIDYWTKVGTPTIEIESLSGKKWARIKSTSQAGYCGISQTVDATPKAQYSFQMLSEIYTQSAYPNGNVVVAFNSIDSKGVKTLIKEVNYDIGEDPKVFTQTFSSLDNTAKIEVIISGQKNANFDFVVTDTKLENYPEPTAWELAIEDMQEALDDKVGNSAEEVFNSLTDNGKMQGIYIDVDEHGVKNYYINGRYVNARNLKVVNNNGVTTLYIDENGNVSLNVSSFILTAGADTNLATKEEVDKVQDNLNNLQIGVRNYIPNSAFKKGMEGYLIQNDTKPGTIELVEFEGRQCIKFTDIGCWDVSKYLRTPTFSFPGDEYLTFSMDVYITKGTKFFIDPDRILDQGDFTIDIPERNKWLRIGGTTVKKSRTSGDTSIAIYAARDTETISGYLTFLKAETGTKPSGWTEAPEDTEASINNKVDVGSSIDDVNQSPGQIEYPKLKIKGAITFEDLSTDNIANNFVPQRDSHGNVTSTLINGATIVAGSITGDLIKAYQLVVTKRKLENGKWVDTTIPTFSISQEGLIQASGTFKSFNFNGDETNLGNSKDGWIITNDGQSVFNNSIIRGRVELPNAGITDSCAPDNEKIDLTKYCRNLLNTPLIVTNPADAIYASSGYPNPPLGMTINSYDQVNNKIKKGEASSNGNCWAIIAAVKAYNHINDTASKNKLKDIIVKSANFMVNNLSVGRFNSMNFKFVDTSYKYNAATKAWERGNYKEIYISSLWLQVRSLLLAFEMTGTTSYKDTALIILDSLYNMHIYINQKVINGELPSKLKGASYDFLACDNLSSSNRFSPSKHFAHQIGFYLCQAIEEVIRIVGDSERTTPKGDKYKPSIIIDNYREYLEKAYNDGLTTSPTGLPYGCYYRTGESPNYEYVQGNWDFINGTWGDSWFVGDVVCYTIYSYAKIGLKDIAKQYLDAYYNLRVDVNSSDWGSRFLGDLVFYDRLDFQGNHLANDNSVSITYTALFYEIARELGYEKYYNICARTLYKWQVKSSNKFIDGGYPWDVSKDGQTLELKSYGEIINSGCHKRLYLKNNEYVTNDNPVRIWAGTIFKDRDNAPYKVLQDGTIISTRGEFSGTFTGRLEIGNISIYDDNTSYGIIDIKNNDNSQSIVRIGEDYSMFKSDVFIGDKDNYMFKTNIGAKQLVSGKQSSIRFEYERDEGDDGIFASSITVSGHKIQFNENEFMKSMYNGALQIGSTSPKSKVIFKSAHDTEVDGIQGEVDVEVHGKASVTKNISIGNVDIVAIYPEGLDFFVN